MDISLSPGMRNSLLSLKETSGKIDRTQERLSTGKNVNSALDNPTNFFLATALRNAASDINQLQTNILENINIIKAAGKGLAGLTSLLDSMKGIVGAAALSTNSDEKMKLARSFDETYAQVNYLVRDSGYGGKNLISDSDSDPLTVTSPELNIPLNPQGSAEYLVAGKFMGSGYVMHEIPGSQPAWVPDDHGDYMTGYGTAGTSIGNLSDVALVIRSSPQMNTLGDVNSDGLVQAGEGTEIDFRLINSSAVTATNVSFSNATISTGWGFALNTSSPLGSVLPGNTVITNTGSDLDLNIPAGTNGAQFSIFLDFTADGVTKKLTFGPLTVGSIANGQVLTANPPTVTLPTVETTTLNVDPADYINGIFGVTFPGPPIENKTMYAEKQGLQIYHSWVYNHFQTEEGIAVATSDLQKAISLVRSYAGELGTSSGVVVVRNDFNNQISNIYRAGADNLTLADMNEEAANMLMLQTRQQLGISSLSLAGQESQGILKALS